MLTPTLTPWAVIMPTPYRRGYKAMLQSVRPSIRPSVCSMNTNRKPHAGSRTHRERERDQHIGYGRRGYTVWNGAVNTDGRRGWWDWWSWRCRRSRLVRGRPTTTGAPWNHWYTPPSRGCRRQPTSPTIWTYSAAAQTCRAPSCLSIYTSIQHQPRGPFWSPTLVNSALHPSGVAKSSTSYYNWLG